MNVILLGPPGAGKGTQARRIQRVLRVPHIASGDIFREIRMRDTPLAAEVRGYMDRGQYVPDDLTIPLILERLSAPDAKDGFLLDGFPRTMPQAEALDRALAERYKQVDVALFIDCATKILAERMRDRLSCPRCHAIYHSVTRPPRVDGICDVCGNALERRSDQDPRVIEDRLRVYARQTQPLVEYYRRHGVLKTVDGAGSARSIEDAVDAALGLRRVQ